VSTRPSYNVRLDRPNPHKQKWTKKEKEQFRNDPLAKQRNQQRKKSQQKKIRKFIEEHLNES